MGRLERADPIGPVGHPRGPLRAMAHVLVEHPKVLPGIQRHLLQPRHPFWGDMVVIPKFAARPYVVIIFFMHN
jgi:hypothetical protein